MAVVDQEAELDRRDGALTRSCSKNCSHDFLEAKPDFRRRAFLHHDGAGHSGTDQHAGWHA
jgi:hypothetical protein